MARDSTSSPFSPAAILSGLLGAWTIERNVTEGATLTGVARFTRTGEDEAAYHETGTLRLSTGYEVAAERRYIYRSRANGLAVFFDEQTPRLFHEVALVRAADGSLRGEAEHVCAEDVYRTDYNFGPDGGFRIRHRVHGPRKDYTIVTVYRKIAGAG